MPDMDDLKRMAQKGKDAVEDLMGGDDDAEAGEEYSPQAAAPGGGFTTSAVATPSGSSLQVVYHGLPNNQPVTYGNFFTWWQNLNEVPWTQGITNDKVAPTENTQAGSVSKANIYVGTEAYLVGWAVGKDLGNVVATYYIPASGGTPPANPGFAPSLAPQPNGIGPNSVVLDYEMPPGSNPNQYKHWVGLWEGTAASYTRAPANSARVEDSAASSAVAINGVKFRRGRQYTVAYFAGGWADSNPVQTTMAVTTTFSV